MKNWLNNKTVVITGASGGLGFSLAKSLITKFNCKVIGIARNEEKLLKNLESLGDKKENFSYKLFDVSKKENWIDFAKSLQDHKINVDVLINNAGFMHPFIKAEKLSFNEIDEITNTNFLSVVYSTKVMLSLIKKSKTPAIINIASSASYSAVIGESMYVATKFAVRGFTKTLAVENKKVYVAGVYPGFIKTDIFSRVGKTEKKNLIDKVSMPLEKATRKIVKKIARKKRSICTGFDGNSLRIFGTLFPYSFPKTMAKVLKASKLDIMQDLFNE